MKRAFGIVAALALAAAPALAQKPTAAQILERYVAVTGGKAYGQIRSTITRGTLTMTAQNIKGTYEVQAKAPNKFVVRQSIEKIGETAQGFDGVVGWSMDPFTGLRTLSGKELGQLKDSAVFNGTAQWRTMFTRAELLGSVKVGTSPAYRIRLTSRTGSVQTQYFDRATGLLVRMDTIVESPQGKLPTESYLSDYKLFDGVRTPTRIRQVVPGMAEVVILIAEVKNNVAIPDTVFARPKEAPSKPVKMGT